MKIKFLALPTFLYGFLNTVHALPVSELHWQDNNFKQCIFDIARENNWQDALEFTSIKCHGKDIKIVNSLDRFPNLTYLSLFNNQITDLDLSHNPLLTYINVAKNQLTSINVTQLHQVEVFYGFQNKLEYLDLREMRGLTKLKLMDNSLQTFWFSGLPNLVEASLFNNKLKTLSIDAMKALKFLDVRQNPMPDELYDQFDSMQGITISHDGNADDWK